MSNNAPTATSADALIHLLADGEFHSGQDCADRLGISRAAVHKAIEKLSSNYQLNIDRLSGRGYRIANGLDLLNPTQIYANLPAQTASALSEIIYIPSLASTNQYCLANVRDNAKPIACFTEFQSHGRGRRGKQWYSPFAQNLYFSLTWTFSRDLNALRGLSLLVGLAIARYLNALSIKNVGLKWPNDIFIDQHKAGGILLEVVGDAAGPCTVIIGIGLNVKMQIPLDDRLQQPWTDIASHCPDHPNRNQLAAGCLASLITHLQQCDTEPMTTFIASWQAFDVLVGQEITCQTPQGVVSGIAQGVNENGELLIQTAHQRLTLNSGEVAHVRAQNA